MILVLTALFFSTAASAELKLPERPQAHVNDYANILTPTAVAGLESKFNAFEQRTGHQAAVAIFSNLEDTPIEDVAVKLFEKWKLGSKKENDGILLVMGLQEHALRIEVGYGLEPKLPDALAGRIIHDDMVPFLRQNQIATAILAFEKRLEEIFIEGKTPAYAANNQSRKDNPLIVILVVIFIVFIFPAIFRRQRYYGIGSSGVNTWWGGGWGGGGGWSSGGGGGGWGGGGGGSSGGGGASGNW